MVTALQDGSGCAAFRQQRTAMHCNLENPAEPERCQERADCCCISCQALKSRRTFRYHYLLEFDSVLVIAHSST